MHPMFFHFGFIEIRTYGILMVVGFLIGLNLLMKKTRQAGLDSNKVSDIAFYSLIIALAGARLTYVLTNLSEFTANPLDIFKFWQGGLVFYGGLIVGVGCYFYFFRKYKMPPIKILDMASPSMALGHFFGRLGCFAAGCCHGRTCAADFPLAVKFSDPLSLAPPGVPLHPAQLYDALNAFILFVLLEWLYRRQRFEGQVLAVYGMTYAIGRSIVEEYRGDTDRGYVFYEWLSTSRFIAIIIFVLSLIAYRYWSQKAQLRGLSV